MKPFLDTNILVYAATADEPAKQDTAKGLLTTWGLPGCTISTQVLAEMYNVLAHRKRWAPGDALQAVQMYTALRVVVLGADAVLAALALAASQRLSTWDAMIVQAALEAGCDTLFSEDMQAGRRFGALQVVNPFVPTAHEAVAGSLATALPPAPALASACASANALRPARPATGKARGGRSRR